MGLAGASIYRQLLDTYGRSPITCWLLQRRRRSRRRGLLSITTFRHEASATPDPLLAHTLLRRHVRSQLKAGSAACVRSAENGSGGWVRTARLLRRMSRL